MAGEDVTNDIEDGIDNLSRLYRELEHTSREDPRQYEALLDEILRQQETAISGARQTVSNLQRPEGEPPCSTPPRNGKR